MQERNIIGGVVSSILAPFLDNIAMVGLWTIVAIVLISADLHFGLNASRRRGEKIRTSRAVRRTLNKFVDYLCWVSIAWVLGSSIGVIFGIPLIPAIIMLLVCLIELSSIINNYLEARGIAKKFNAFKMFFHLIRHPEYADVFEDKKEEDDYPHKHEQRNSNKSKD